jgi:hypothetical protein
VTTRYPLRVAGSIVGGLTAVINGLVGSGLFTTAQGNATTGVISAVLTLLAAFGIVISTERKVTPLTDPRDQSGRPLTADAPPEDERGW